MDLHLQPIYYPIYGDITKYKSVHLNYDFTSTLYAQHFTNLHKQSFLSFRSFTKT